MNSNGLKIALRIISTLVLLVFLAAAIIYCILRASLPKLDGEVALPKLSQAVTLSRDAQGTATIAAGNMADAMRSLGFVHAQERFFEMDLARRSAAGELSALLGKATIAADKEKRAHRFRQRMSALWKTLPATNQADAAMLTAYADGVNAGLAALGSKPWQYALLQTEPRAWLETDSLLVMCEMLYMLQARSIDDAFINAQLREKLGDALYSWMRPLGGTWDAALDGSVIAEAAMPTAEKLNVRNVAVEPITTAALVITNQTTNENSDDAATIGSNAWAVGGALTAHGGAMLANDMHLGLGVPNIWFRTQIEIAGAGEGKAQRLVGVTLPGVPALVAGSNGHIAWGFTNSYGKWFGWVPLSATDEITVQNESIEVKGGDAVELAIRESRFGPVLKTVDKQNYALNWLGHRPGAINTNLSKLAFAKSVDEALLIAQQSGGPHQNIFIVDKFGNSAWTIMGKMPTRAKVNNSTRAGFTAAENIDGDWLPAAQYPVIKNPPEQRLWSGNNRQLDGVGGAEIGDGGFDLGARGQQIRDRLREQKQFDEAALYKIQLDTEARFLKRWVANAGEVAESSREAPNSLAALTALKSWNGRADADQAGYRIARAYRLKVLETLWKSWLAATPAASLKAGWDHRFEYAVWQAISVKAPHLLPQPHATWDAFLSAQLSAVNKEMLETNSSLAEATWGKRNTAKIVHPIARAIPQLGFLLNMPATPLSGDNHLPKVVAPGFGASERLVVAPGHEETAIMTMPGGQSGHPLSPFYGAGHQDWLDGNPVPLLAGEAKYRLVLKLGDAK